MINKKGLSGIVTTVILIAVVIAAIGIVWVVINQLVSEELEEAQSCFDIFGKIEIDDIYTCYHPATKELDVSVRTEVSIDELLISVTSKSGSKSFRVTKDGNSESFAKPYGAADWGASMRAPGKGEGLTYVVDVAAAGVVPEGPADALSIRVIPTVGGKQCDVADSLVGVQSC